MNRKSLNFKIEKSKIQIVNEYLKSKSFVSNQAHLKIKKICENMCPHAVTHVAQIVLFLDEPGCSQKFYSLDIHLLFGFYFFSI